MASIVFEKPGALQRRVQRQHNAGSPELLVVAVGTPLMPLSHNVLRNALGLQAAIQEEGDWAADAGYASAASPSGPAERMSRAFLAAAMPVAFAFVSADDNAAFYLENGLVAGLPLLMLFHRGTRVKIEASGRAVDAAGWRSLPQRGRVNTLTAGAVVGHLSTKAMRWLVDEARRQLLALGGAGGGDGSAPLGSSSFGGVGASSEASSENGDESASGGGGGDGEVDPTAMGSLRITVDVEELAR